MNDGPGRQESPISRRQMLLGRLRSRGPDAIPDATPDASSLTPTRDTQPLCHRPPGAVDEARFVAECTRCGDCIDACPVDAIRLADDRAGPAAGTPVIEPMVSACVMCDDLPCIASCEPGVLSPTAPVKMGTASIRAPYCLAHQGTFCTVCVERCPVDGALQLVDNRPVIDAETCTGCGVCQYVCPAPYNAVLILPRTDRLGSAGDPDPESPPPAGFDWRDAYFGGRSLRPEDRP
ncbi:MAG: 4Fe-4S dicluster domain-containing protein [Phycisphaerales bacterium]|nr:4Fe-4S dicluster domain-containing protein [Phycisphaerae bacterium]NNF43661.1 4Fe-4S dicluster domain-containing protein [Phycisphaerales bacterium]NNM26995.1 4Fe-4S dicluster domain-containing protein [Phycisphaerales bacterium]